VLEPGEMVMFPNSIVHGSSINLGPDRRFLLLVEMLPTWAERPRGRESAMLVRGMDTFDHFDDEPRPDGEFTPTALANWQRVVESRAKRSSRTAATPPARPTEASAPRRSPDRSWASGARDGRVAAGAECAPAGSPTRLNRRPVGGAVSRIG